MVDKTLHRQLQIEQHMCPKRLDRVCLTSATRRVSLSRNHMINHQRGNEDEIANGTDPWKSK